MNMFSVHDRQLAVKIQVAGCDWHSLIKHQVSSEYWTMLPLLSCFIFYLGMIFHNADKFSHNSAVFFLCPTEQQLHICNTDRAGRATRQCIPAALFLGCSPTSPVYLWGFTLPQGWSPKKSRTQRRRQYKHTQIDWWGDANAHSHIWERITFIRGGWVGRFT